MEKTTKYNIEYIQVNCGYILQLNIQCYVMITILNNTYQLALRKVCVTDNIWNLYCKNPIKEVCIATGMKPKLIINLSKKLRIL